MARTENNSQAARDGDTRYVGRDLPPLPLEPTRCCICCGELGGDGHGHNASPVMEGRCCGACNGTIVVSTRIVILANERSRMRRRAAQKSDG